jgi:hypothetical protein
MGKARPYLNPVFGAAKIHSPLTGVVTCQTLLDSEKRFSNLGNSAEYCRAFAADAMRGAYVLKAMARHACCSKAYPLDTSLVAEEMT